MNSNCGVDLPSSSSCLRNQTINYQRKTYPRMKSLTTIFGAITVVCGAIMAACIPGTLPDGVIKPEDIPHWLKVTAFLGSIVFGKLAFYFTQDKASSVKKSKSPLPIPILFFLATLAFFACSVGCATLDKGADPLVVRVEQTQAIATSTFQTFLKLDHDNVEFYKVHAPEMHRLAEYLRERRHDGDRRWIAYLRALDKIKLDYKAHRANANDVMRILSVVQSAITQVTTLQLEGK